jgi:hypothetical protein
MLEFAWRDWGKPWTASVSIAGLWAEIWTQDLLNKKQEWEESLDLAQNGVKWQTFMLPVFYVLQSVTREL